MSLRKNSSRKLLQNDIEPLHLGKTITFSDILAVIRGMFTVQFYSSEVWNGKTTFFGYPICKPPSDAWVLQEIIFDTKPTVVIETGTWYGGSTLYLALMGDIQFGYCGIKLRVISIDINEYPGRPRHDNIKYLIGSSIDPYIVEEVKKLIKEDDRVMVILDSNHKASFVERELEIYSKLVTKDMYLVVEDTMLNGNPVELHPSLDSSGPGPKEAVDRFLEANKDFEVDHNREKFLMTFCPGGYLRKVIAQ